MKWVFPEFLFALAVILIPLLIHLFHFKRYKTVFFSSLTFLKSVEQSQKNTRKLKYWLIFTMRALAFCFLVLAFAQPYFPLQNDKQKSGVNVIAVYVDNSFSMSRVGQTGELLSQARELGKSIVEEAPRDAQFVLATNELSGDEKQTLTKAQFLDKIEKLKFSPLIRSANDVVRWWQQWIKDNERNELRIANSQLIYLSDFQKETVGKLKKITNWNTLLYPVVLEPVNTGNLFVDSIWFETPVHKFGSKQTVYALIRNEGAEAATLVDVAIKVGKVNREVFADIPAFGVDTVQLSYFNAYKGKIQGSITINDKQMTQDDAFYFSLEVKTSSGVLIVDGENAVTNVQIVYGLDDFYAVKSVNQQQFSSNDLKGKDLVVINGLNQFSASIANVLKEFTEDGGCVLLFPGANVSAAGWNSFLTKTNLPTIGGVQEAGLALKKINTADPFFNGVFERNPENFNLPAVKKAYRLQSGGSSQSVSLLTYQNGNPFFVKGTGKQSVYLSSTSLDPSFSSFTSNQLFSTLLLRTAELSQRKPPYFLTIGENGSFPIAQASSAEAAVHIQKGPIDFIPTVFNKREQAYVSVQGIEAIRQLEAGNYAVTSQQEQLGTLSINYNRNESVVKSLNKKEIESIFTNAGITPQPISKAAGWTGASFLQLEQPITYWKWCVILAILFLFGEMIIVIFYKR